MVGSLSNKVLALVAGFAMLQSSWALAQGTEEPVVPLPAPRGQFLVGTTVADFSNGSRLDPGFPDGRPVTLQLWYPAARATSATAPYLVEPGLAAALRHYQYYGVDSVTLDRWARLPTHSFVDAPPAD